MSAPTNEQFRMIAAELVERGEDADEMRYWSDIFPDLPEDKRQKLFDSFKRELEELSAVG